MSSRSGKHKDGNVRMGIYLTPERKALAVHLSESLNKTLTDIIWEGILAFAKEERVVRPDGTIDPKHRAAIATATAVIKATNNVKG